MIPLQNRLALHRFICWECSHDDTPAMLERLRDVPARLIPFLKAWRWGPEPWGWSWCYSSMPDRAGGWQG